MEKVKTLALPEMPNEMTVRAFTEDKHSMPIFDTVDELRRDLVVKRKIRRTSQFKKDVKRMLKSGKNLEKLLSVVNRHAL